MNAERLIQLKPEEEVLMAVRQSFVPLIPRILLAFVWVVLPFFFLFSLFNSGTFGVIVFFALLISGLFYAYKLSVLWKRSVFVVTDRRIVDVHQRGLFKKVVSEASFRLIDDVSYSIQGFVPTVFRYGNVVIQTRGNTVDLEVFQVHRPHLLHDLVNDLREEKKEQDGDEYEDVDVDDIDEEEDEIVPFDEA